MRHPKDMSRRQFLTRAGGAAIAMPSLAAILAACSKPTVERRHAGSASRHPARDPREPGRAAADPGPDPGEHPDGVRPARPLQLGRLHLQEGRRGVRGQVRRQGRHHHLPKHGGGHPEGLQRPGVSRRVRAHARVPSPPGRERPPAAPPARADPEHGEHVAELLRPGPVLRPEVALHRAVHDLHLGRRLSAGPRERRRAAAQGWNALWNHDYAGEISLYDSYGDTIADHHHAQREPRRERYSTSTPGPT